MKDSAQIMQPLYVATTGKTLKWNAKEALTPAPVLAYPNFDGDAPFYVSTDGSANSGGAVLSQVKEGIERMICFPRFVL